MMRRGDKGETVRQLQIMLTFLGYTLPRWGADGDLGEETLSAFALFMHDHKGRDLDDDRNTINDEELAFVQAMFKRGRALLPQMDMYHFHDLRSTAGRERVRGMRSWAEVTGITLHQTACSLGENPDRWKNIGCHVGVTRRGQAIWLHDFNEIVIHGNGFNGRHVGIEIDGLYAGIQNVARTVWDDPTTPEHEVGMSVTDPSVETAQAVIRWIVGEVARHGGKVSLLCAHRQSSDSRQNDPGSELWQRVALPMHAELGLTDGGRDFKVGAGRPIPEAWDPSRTGVPY